MLRFGFILIAFTMCGCAFRSLPAKETTALPPPAKTGSAFEKFTDSYSRNFIVAAPTAVANGVCGAAGGVGGVILLTSLGVTSRNAQGTGELAAYVIGGTIFIGGATCGFVVGLPFIPASYLCAENPWYSDKQGLHTNWSCNLANSSLSSK